ncbi:hypothetical protein HDU82_007650 [Entophlyctis luteolus]|nr:hypothetical protein HDU82_007650 [Entophlyctis luteolus]
MSLELIGILTAKVYATENSFILSLYPYFQAGHEGNNAAFRSELDKLRKHNDYLKKKIESSQKNSFNIGHEMERLLEHEQEK